MCLAQFFGNKSLFDIIVAVVALSTGVYTFYKSFWERAKLLHYPGDRLGLVVSTGGGSRKFHLRANLVNHAVKAGTLHRLEAEITDPKGITHRYQWKLRCGFRARLTGSVRGLERSNSAVLIQVDS